MTLDNSLLKQIKDFKSFIANMIPIAGNNTPNADTTNGNVGNSTTWARSDHSHPKSSLYAEASHAHNEYLTSQDIVNKVDKVAGKDLSTNDFTDSYKDKLDLNFGYVDHNLKLHFVEVDEATLSSSPNVAMNGGITNIMAHITDSENNNVIDAPIDFYQDNVYYDTGITNNNGLASIEYFGNGIGQTNFTVKCGNFVSTPYPVCDAIFYDRGDNSNWYDEGKYSVSTSTDGKTLTVSSATAYYNCNTTTSTNYYFNKGTCIEFDIENADSDFRIYIRNGSTRPYKAITDGHFKITIDGTNVNWDINGTTSTSAFAQDTYFLYFTGDTVGNKFTLKNFKIYPV